MNDLTPAQAQYVLSRMLSEKMVSKGDVARCLATMQSEISDLERRLAELKQMRTGGSIGVSRAAVAMRDAAVAAPKPRKQIKLTPQQRASRQLQGVYMSLIRQFPKPKRGPFQKLGKEKGREVAVEAMKSALGKGKKK